MEAKAEDTGVKGSITEVTEVANKLLHGMFVGVDEVLPEYPKPLKAVEVSWLTHFWSIAWQI